MEQLINQIAQQTGISTSQAQQAVQITFGFLKDRLPAPIASQVEGLLGGQLGNVGGVANQAQQGLGGLQGMANQAQQDLGGLGHRPQ
jgi:hypothetical protein